MDYETSREILSRFRRTHPEVMMRRDIHGIYVSEEIDGLCITILSSGEERSKDLRPDEITPDSFSVDLASGHFECTVQETESERLSIHAKQGEKASYDLDLSYGTVGWNVYFSTQNIWACLSNYHVLVNPNNPQTGTDVYFYDDNGSAVAQAVLHAMRRNDTWDYALARYKSEKDAQQAFKPCQDNTVHPNPVKLA